MDKKRVQVYDVQGRRRGFKVWVICPHCEVGRWVRADYTKRPLFTGLCNKCHAQYTTGKMSQHSYWKGGTTKKDGYIYIRLSPDDMFFPMAKKDHYVREHRLVMAKHLNRCLSSWEIVHHKNNIRDDNRMENLELIKGAVYHLLDNNPKSQITQLKKRIKKLEENSTNGN